MIEDDRVHKGRSDGLQAYRERRDGRQQRGDETPRVDYSDRPDHQEGLPVARCWIGRLRSNLHASGEAGHHYERRTTDQRCPPEDGLEPFTVKVIDDCIVDDVPDRILNRRLGRTDYIRVDVVIKGTEVTHNRDGPDVVELCSRLRIAQEAAAYCKDDIELSAD